MLAEHDEMEPLKIAVGTFGGDAAEAPLEALDLAVVAVDRLDMQGTAPPLAHRCSKTSPDTAPVHPSVPPCPM